MSVPNYVTQERQLEIDSIIDNKLAEIGKSYPDNSLVEIIEAAIPGVRIAATDFQGDRTIRGAIFKKSDDFAEPLIAIQKHLPPETKTFTLAHEFGHYLLDHPGEKNYLVDKIDYNGTKATQREAEAQYFAASLLMPKDKFSRLMRVLSDEELAKRFGVSTAAVRIRKKWLNGKTYHTQTQEQ